MKKVELSFEAGEGRHFCGGVNFMTDRDGLVYAECRVPEGSSEDYGYLAMKEALQKAVNGKISLKFWYPDYQDYLLANDASADCDVYTDIDIQDEPETARISINNGHDFVTPEEAVAGCPWEVIVSAMDDEVRETVHAELAPCTDREFLTRYLELATDDLVIG